MKKVLSIMLATMMIASLFAMNASAAIPTGYEKLEGYIPDTELYLQDFSDITTNADYTDKAYDGSREVREDGILHMFGSYRTGMSSYTYQDAPITSGKYTYEFDFMRNDDFSTDLLLSITFQRAANANSENENLKRYGLVIPIRTVGLRNVDGFDLEDTVNPCIDIEPHKWYKFRVMVDEEAFVAAGGSEKSNAELTALIKVERKAEDEDTWTKLTYSSYSHFISNAYRSYGSSMSNLKITDKEVIFGVGKDSYGEPSEVKKDVPKLDENGAPVLDETTGEPVLENKTIKDDDFRNADFQIDNIRIYVPGEEGEMVAYDYPINKGVAYTQTSDEITIEMIGKDSEVKDEAGNVIGTEKVPGTIYGTGNIQWAYEPASFVATFDAVNDVAGGPLSIAFAGKEAGSHIITIAPTEEGKLYSYKALYTNNGANVAVQSVYRKAEDENEWTLLTVNNEYWHGYNSSGSKNQIRWYLYGGLKGDSALSNCELGTKWTIKNMQVTDSYAMTGTATVADGELTIDLNTVVADATTLVAAVYDGDRMVAAQAVDVAAFANEKEIKVPFAASIANPSVKIFVLDGMGTMVPMDIPVDITAAIN